MFLLANNVDFTEEVIATRAEESEVCRTPTNVVEEEVVSKSVTNSLLGYSCYSICKINCVVMKSKIS